MRFPRHVSQNMTVLLSSGPVLLNVGPPFQANRPRDIRQNSVKYRPTHRTTGSPLQRADELHQKDLRINLFLGHILGPGTEANLRADTFLALSLIVPYSVLRDPYTARRIDIPVKRPCKLLEIRQFLRIKDI